MSAWREELAMVMRIVGRRVGREGEGLEMSVKLYIDWTWANSGKLVTRSGYSSLVELRAVVKETPTFCIETDGSVGIVWTEQYISQRYCMANTDEEAARIFASHARFAWLEGRRAARKRVAIGGQLADAVSSVREP